MLAPSQTEEPGNFLDVCHSVQKPRFSLGTEMRARQQSRNVYVSASTTGKGQTADEVRETERAYEELHVGRGEGLALRAKLGLQDSVWNGLAVCDVLFCPAEWEDRGCSY